jgi:hypothetical protein
VSYNLLTLIVGVHSELDPIAEELAARCRHGAKSPKLEEHRS